MIVAVVLVAAIIRFWNFRSLGYQHWDEYFFIRGANAVNAAWPKGLKSIPYVTTPLLAYTDGTLFHFLGARGWIPLAVSATYGVLSSVAVYFLGSRLFGNAVGLIAGVAVATAEFSVMFSRMALADATFDFWLITCVLFVWLGFTRRRFGYWAVAGVSAGVTLNTKYDGAFPLILAVSWLIAEFVIDLAKGRREFLSKAWSEYRLRVLGAAGMVVIALVIYAPWLYRLARNPGLDKLFGHQAGFFVDKTPPIFILWYYWLFTSPLTVILALAGIAVALIRFTRADRLLLIYTAGWVVAVILFGAYPREALSLLPAVAIWAGRAIVEAWKLVVAYRPRWQLATTTVATACVLAIAIGQFLPLPHMLSLRTRGYADAGVIAARYQASGSTIIVRTQDVAYLYLRDDTILRNSPLVVQLLKDKGSGVVIITDQTMMWFVDIRAFFELNRDRLKVIDRVANPMYDELMLQPATYDKLANLANPPDEYRYITFWRVTAPLLYPPNWPQ